MKMVLSHFNYWCKAKDDAQLTDSKIEMLDSASKSPQLDWVPAMQRRRLSHYAKMALFVAANSAKAYDGKSLPVVYASQHGDFHRTSSILKDLAEGEVVSPTSFGLSVHNAVVGLYSILTKNQQPMNSIAAGENTLLMALIEAYVQLNKADTEQVLVVYCDQPLTKEYAQFDHQDSVDLACAFIVSKNAETGISLNLSCSSDSNKTPLQAKQFVEFLATKDAGDSVVLGAQTSWQITIDGVKHC
ncbi:beta-ketoacyl synthase chain length factor [Pseudoalteromonas piratica]|uniref:beta-ketoacyl synthase chain length factor n=1 Tax=Pseudoalteromonas piratica TaxID=1348114 RepID=UPI00068C7DB1|nr:beta-ketoacyl synthase chain length factor [Pseudoalteromonas piratica]